MATPGKQTELMLQANDMDVTRSVILEGETEDVDLESLHEFLNSIPGGPVSELVARKKKFYVQFETEGAAERLGDLIQVSGKTLVVSHPDTTEDPRTANTTIELDRLSKALQKLDCEKNDAEQRLQTQKEEFERMMQRERAMFEDRLKTMERDIERAAHRPAASPSRVTGTHSASGVSSSETMYHVPVTAKDSEKINVQVEHIVRGDREQSFHRIRPFSGNDPKSGEVCYEEWSKQVELMMEDDGLSDKAKRQKILSSLHYPR